MKYVKCDGVIYVYLVIYITVSHCSGKDVMPDENSELEVRSVFLNCELEDTNDVTMDSEFTRFQREELFKHNSLRNCRKKLAVTIKMCNKPQETSVDEYIPIEHILGANNKRTRLLNPYILRLRRDRPYQIYKIRILDTVAGSFGIPSEKQFRREDISYKSNRRSSTKVSSQNLKFDNESEVYRLDSSNNDKYYLTSNNVSPSKRSISLTENTQSLNTKTNNVKMNRHFKNAQELGQGLRRGFDDQTNIYLNNVTSSPHTSPSETYFVLYEIGRPDIWSNAQIQLYEKVTTFEGKTMWNDLTQQGPVSIYRTTVLKNNSWRRCDFFVHLNICRKHLGIEEFSAEKSVISIFGVSTVDPIWKNNDLSVRYRTKDFINREEFELPAGSLCLVLPLMKQSIYLKGNGDIGKFVIVPIDDVIVVKSQKESGRDELNNADLDTSIKNKRHVIIRTSRALMGGSMADLDIVERGSDRYLKLPHRLPHHAQLDLETRADENKLIIPGSSARLTSIVSDTRKLRSTLYLQVTNTGLAPAYFSLTTRDCNPRLDFNENEAVTLDTEKCLIPPMHTKKFTMELPLEKSFEDYTCTIALLNGDGETVATRDVRIKADDRCFCIRHCECVCLTDDPKLLCRNMPELEQVAAGISTLESPRRTRSACYPDTVSINIFVVFIGVLLMLIIFGIIKAILGLFLPCVGSWGLEFVLKVPRKLDRYYESSLKCRTVAYDKDGWPVHPDTKKRSVLLVSKYMEFILNVLMFVILPCVILWDAINQLIFKCQNVADEKVGADVRHSSSRKCFSTQNMQTSEPRWRRRTGGMRKWMTPQAEELSTDIWQYGLSPTGAVGSSMQPLLTETTKRGGTIEKPACQIDSEQDDTEYVLMQMQKSKESLAIQ